MREDRPVTFLFAGLYERSTAIDKYRRRSKRLPAPDTFPLDLRIVSEGAARRRWKAKIDRVAEVVTGETQAQANRVLADDTLNGVFASEHRARKRLRPGPQRRLQSPFSGERWNDTTLRCFGQQTKRAIQIRLAASVWTRDEIQPVERDDEITQRPIARDRKCVEHQLFSQ